MKKFILAICLSFMSLTAIAQENHPNKDDSSTGDQLRIARFLTIVEKSCTPDGLVTGHKTSHSLSGPSIQSLILVGYKVEGVVNVQTGKYTGIVFQLSNGEQKVYGCDYPISD